ncbi:MAG: hypothetical protein JXR97_14180, partial [Planctomycetes bacterium]|nr:hypothetical protein [Planctomycetota bacterium]
GPGLFIAFHYAEEGEMMSWNPAAIIVLLVFGLVAPMGFLCSATVSAIGGVNPVIVFKGIASLVDKYAYMLLTLLVSSGLFILLGIWIGGKASVALGGDTPNYPVGFGLRILSGLLFMFPMVIFARSIGMLVKYWDYKLPFEVDLYSESKGSIAPQIVAFIAAAMLFMPLHSAAKEWTQQGGMALKCKRQIREIYDKHLRYESGRVHYPSNRDEFDKYVPQDARTCPAFPEEKDFYTVKTGLSAQDLNIAPRLLLVYESKPTYPDGEQLNVLLLNGEVRTISKDKLAALLEIQERYAKSADKNEKEQAYKAYLMEMAKF